MSVIAYGAILAKRGGGIKINSKYRCCSVERCKGVYDTGSCSDLL